VKSGLHKRIKLYWFAEESDAFWAYTWGYTVSDYDNIHMVGAVVMGVTEK